MQNGHCKRSLEALNKSSITSMTNTFVSADPILNSSGKEYSETYSVKTNLPLANVAPNSIVIAHDLSPADTAQLLNSSVIGFVTEVGGRTSHTAIMARSLELPAVVAVDGLVDEVGTGDILVVDGSNGRVHVNPSPTEVRRYQERQIAFIEERAKLERLRDGDAVTTDGRTIHVSGNIELPEETPFVLEHGANGVGLFRTEFLYMNRSSLPTEEEQFIAYRKVIEECSPSHIDHQEL